MHEVVVAQLDVSPTQNTCILLLDVQSLRYCIHPFPPGWQFLKLFCMDSIEKLIRWMGISDILTKFGHVIFQKTSFNAKGLPL